MHRIICGKVYDTATASVVKKLTSGSWGDPCGYEETLFVTPEGYYFLYTNGGADSKYKAEKMVRKSKATAAEWLKNA